MKKIILFTFLVVGSIIYATNLSNSMEIVNAESALMHGPKNLKRYPKCNKCLVVRCSGNTCTGHCKRNKKLFDCSTKHTPNA